MAQYEIEIKALLGGKECADALKVRMCELDPACIGVAQSRQLNHYFRDGDVHVLYENVSNLFGDEERLKLKAIITKGSKFSVRTRQKDDQVLLVLKASVDEGSSENAVSRLEFEEEVPVTLPELDVRVISAGFAYQAKWSREREEYSYKGINVCVDKNAGYGYLAEFEKVVHGDDELSSIKKDLEDIMNELDVRELPQDRLERMFSYYNENWPEYYGTDRTFVIE